MSVTVPFDLAIFLLGTFAAAFVTGLAGFAFGMVAAGIWLFALTPAQTTTLYSSSEAPSEFPRASPFLNWHRLCI
jgi:uncharacterized membrane protein YfcA